MDGRWTLLVNRQGEAWICDPDVSVFPQTGEALTPVVPCDVAAVERAGDALFQGGILDAIAEDAMTGRLGKRDCAQDAHAIAELVLRAAGEAL